MKKKSINQLSNFLLLSLVFDTNDSRFTCLQARVLNQLEKRNGSLPPQIYSSEVVGHRGHLYPKRRHTGTCVMTKKGLLLPFPTLAHPFKSRETFFFFSPLLCGIHLLFMTIKHTSTAPIRHLNLFFKGTISL